MPSSSVKRQRRRKRVDEDGDPEFQVAPMVDVLLVLLLFFMSITSTELLKKVKNVELPEAKNATPSEKKLNADEMVVNVGWNSSNSTAVFTVDEVRYPTADAMQGIISSRIQQNPKTYVLIRADKDVEYSNISDLMKTCASAGVATVTFAVLTGDVNDKKPGAAASGAAQ
jgi:biopolymer transport protein ExbD